MAQAEALQLPADVHRIADVWHVFAHYKGGGQAILVGKDESGKLQPLCFPDDRDCVIGAAITAHELRKVGVQHLVEEITTKDQQVKPPPPFTTSALQQAGSAVLMMRPEETMAAAQRLFEAGVITCHCTDSVHLSDDAVQMARSGIAKFAPEALPPTAPVYKSRAGSQEAHEAIRPTALDVDLLYQFDEITHDVLALIIDRFLASQCSPAKLRHIEVRIRAGVHDLLVKGSEVLDPGHKLFTREQDDEQSTALDYRIGQTLVVEKTSVEKAWKEVCHDAG